jgi:Rieske Fe-S protein
MSESPSYPDTQASCERCPVAIGRREFMRGLMAGVVSVSGLTRALGALPRSAVESTGRVGTLCSYPIPAADGVQIDHHNEVILVRWENMIYAFNLSCPHQNTALRWIASDHEFQCPKHHSQYKPDGEFISGRATRGMDRFTIQRQGETVVVDVDQMIKQSEDAAAWNATAVRIT